MKTNAQFFLNKFVLGRGDLDKIWILGLAVTQLGDTYNFQEDVWKKAGWNLEGRCAIVYADDDFLFMVLLFAVDGL